MCKKIFLNESKMYKNIFKVNIYSYWCKSV